MPLPVPPTKPRMSASDLIPRVQALGLDPAAHPLMVVGVRGYYLNSMGATGANDTGIYDDALFLVSPSHFSAYNANTDPSKRKPGTGFGRGKGMARLQPGVWLCYRFDQHKGPSTPGYDAICQRGDKVKVMRDGTPDYADEGMFGINIHKGGRNTTSSEGCQTIHPSQWDAFIVSAQDQARRHFGTAWKRTTIPYVLMVNDWD